MSLTSHLIEVKERIEAVARSLGLDFFETVFELVNYDRMNEIASYGGFPKRYPHWRFGMEYEQLSKSYTYGLQKVYELVINNNPCYAYLMESNEPFAQKVVMAHVYAHSDFFKRNLWFSGTDRKAINTLANHGVLVWKYIHRYGYEEVEKFLDQCLSIDNMIDPYSVFSPKNKSEEKEEETHSRKKLESKTYMDSFINTEEFLAERDKKVQEAKKKKKQFPQNPERDLLLFLLENAKLENWQQNILSMVREESYYFGPQAQTKIMNEGWASYWHSRIMTEVCLEDSELVDYADQHSATMGESPGVLNPYKLGLALFRDIEDRWNKGKFGLEYEDCENLRELELWDKQLGQGKEKIFEVRKIYNDVTFIDSFLTKEFASRNHLFTYSVQGQGDFVIQRREFEEIKRTLLFNLSNRGQPIVEVLDGNYKNRGELYLKHLYEGIPLDLEYAKATLKNITSLWGRPVHIEMVHGNHQLLLSFDSHDFKEILMGVYKK